LGEADPRLYIRLAARIRRQLVSGELAPGDPVPSINVLRQERGYTRATCGKALQVPERERLLIRIPALGCFVRTR
jgi:DNA-binding GntR family transcriptional regulator